MAAYDVRGLPEVGIIGEDRYRVRVDGVLWTGTATDISGGHQSSKANTRVLNSALEVMERDLA